MTALVVLKNSKCQPPFCKYKFSVLCYSKTEYQKFADGQNKRFCPWETGLAGKAALF